jgi:hypothetical protein
LTDNPLPVDPKLDDPKLDDPALARTATGPEPTRSCPPPIPRGTGALGTTSRMGLGEETRIDLTGCDLIF